VGPAQMGPIFCARGIFLLQWNLENRQLGEKDNNLSHQQMGAGLASIPGGRGPGSVAT